MTLRQLSYVLAVADAGSFTEAARRLHVAQPSLSQQIRALEEELGGRLLERPPRPVRLTAAGRAFVAEARPAVSTASTSCAWRPCARSRSRSSRQRSAGGGPRTPG